MSTNVEGAVKSYCELSIGFIALIRIRYNHSLFRVVFRRTINIWSIHLWTYYL